MHRPLHLARFSSAVSCHVRLRSSLTHPLVPMRAPLSGASPCCCPAPPPSLSPCARGCPASTRFRPRLFVLGSFQLLFGSFGGSLRPSPARSRRDLVLPARRGRPWELSCPRLSSPARPQSDSVRLSPTQSDAACASVAGVGKGHVAEAVRRGSCISVARCEEPFTEQGAGTKKKAERPLRELSPVALRRVAAQE